MPLPEWLLWKKKYPRMDKTKNALKNDVSFTLTASLEENKKNIKKLFERCDDLSLRDFVIDRHFKAFAFYFESLSSSEDINRFVLEEFMHSGAENTRTLSSADSIIKRFLPVHDIKSTRNINDVLLGVYSGDCIILINGITEALVVNTRKLKGRLVTDPLIETTAIGPQEGFVEDLQLNIALIRKRVKTANMKIESFEIGRISKSTLVVSYIEGTAEKSLVEEIKKRILSIDTDGFIDTGHLRRFINDSKYSPFPHEIMTERPDRCVNFLLEGRIVVLLDGSPFILVYPSVFVDILKTADEAYMHFHMALFLRFIRFIALMISTLGSAVYIALTVFHPGMIPTQLLITIAGSRAGIPFPAIMEALLMELIFEILREASIRIPKPIGPSISIVGGLVIGQSVVDAGIASQAMIIVIALTAITSFAVPGYVYNSTLRLIRFPMMIVASVSGMYGIISIILFIMIHMVSLRSVGVPYLSPLAPLNLRDIQNTILHSPSSSQIYRPSFLETPNPVHTSKSSDRRIPRKGASK